MRLSEDESGVLIRGRYVLTSSSPELIADGAVRVVGDLISAVGPFAELVAAHPRDSVAGSARDIVTAGFVNAHGHFSEALLSGIAEQFALYDWIDAVVKPVAPHLNAEMAYVGTLLAGSQLLRGGVTITNDMFVYEPSGGEPATPGVVRALDELNLRGVVSFGARDRGSAASRAALLDEHTALADAADASRLSRFRVGVPAVGAQSRELFADSVRLAVDGGHGVHIHLHEVREEVAGFRRAEGLSPIAYCARQGLFEAPVLAAHCVWTDAGDRELLAANGVGVAHNPVSNMILASGVCELPDLVERGVAIGIGVDGAASNDRQDMLEAIKSTVLLQRVARLSPAAMSARDAFRMATIGGARALGIADRHGSLEPGKAADVVVFDGDAPAMANPHDPFQTIVYCAGHGDVRDVWVAGRRAVADRVLTGVDVGEVVERSRALAADLAHRAGLGPLSLLAGEQKRGR